MAYFKLKAKNDSSFNFFLRKYKFTLLTCANKNFIFIEGIKFVSF